MNFMVSKCWYKFHAVSLFGCLVAVFFSSRKLRMKRVGRVCVTYTTTVVGKVRTLNVKEGITRGIHSSRID